MNESENFIKVYIRSKKVPSRTVVLESYSPSIVGLTRSFRCTLQFEDRLDEAQKSLIEDAERLALSFGVPIQIIDLSKLNAVSRVLRRILGFPRIPRVVLSGKLFSRIVANPFTKFEHSEKSIRTKRLMEQKLFFTSSPGTIPFSFNRQVNKAGHGGK
jgi:hypothetical protein